MGDYEDSAKEKDVSDTKDNKCNNEDKNNVVIKKTYTIPKTDKTEVVKCLGKREENKVLSAKNSRNVEHSSRGIEERKNEDNHNRGRHRRRKKSKSRSPPSRGCHKRSKSRSRNRSGGIITQSGGGRSKRLAGRSPKRPSPRRQERSRRRSGDLQNKISASGGRIRRVLRSRSNSRIRSDKRWRPSARNSRRSQSCSPERLVKNKVAKQGGGSNLDTLQDESLLKMKEHLLQQLNMEDDVEEGEISDSGDEEVNLIMTNVDISNRKSAPDLRNKLGNRNEGVSEENVRSRSISGDGSDKENTSSKQIEKKDRLHCEKKDDDNKDICGEAANKKEEECVSNVSGTWRPDLLRGFSSEDIEHKLIPFKKRQFKELQFEEIKIKKQLERARSKSKTPVRSPPRSVGDSSSVSPGISSASPTLHVTTESQARKVSPIKLCIKDVVIERPSSSSSEAILEQVSVVDSRPPSQFSYVEDDEATTTAAAIDISADLSLTDDSESEPSPVKKALPHQESNAFRKPKIVMKKLQASHKQAEENEDISSPEGISNLLRSSVASANSNLSTSSSSHPSVPSSSSSTNVKPPAKRKKKQFSCSNTNTVVNFSHKYL